MRLKLTLIWMIMLIGWGLGRAQVPAACSTADVLPQRGDLVCQEGYVQVEQIFDYNVFDAWAAIRERAGGLGIPGWLAAVMVNVKYRLKGYSVRYWTQAPNPDGVQPAPLTEATGLVIFPQRVGCRLPIALYCHGTILERDLVPSQPENYREEFLAALGYAGDGYLTVVPDYVGMGEGSADFHPYLDATTEAAASIDLVRAAEKIADMLDNSISGEVFIAGHSQGAHAGMATLRSLATENSYGFRVKYAGLSSGPYDLSETQLQYILDHPDDYPADELPLMVLAGCQEARCGSLANHDYCFTEEVLEPQYIENPYEDFLLAQATGARASVSEPWPAYFLDAYEDNIARSDLKNDCLAANNVYDWHNRNRTTLFYCGGDRHISPRNATKTKDVQRRKIPWYRFWERWQINTLNCGNLDHVSCALPSLFLSRWLFSLTRNYCFFFREETTLPQQAPNHGVYPFLYFDLDIDLTAFSGTLKQVDMVDLEDQVVRSWGKEALNEPMLTLQRGDLPAGLYGLVFHKESGQPDYVGILVQDPEIAESERYDPISPNPMRKQARLDLSLLEEPVNMVTVYDPEGRRQQRMHLEPGAPAAELLRQDLPSGDYVVEVRSDRQSYFLPLHLSPDDPRSLLQVRPNPVRDIAVVDFTALLGEVESVQLFSSDGRLVRTFTNPTGGSLTQELFVGDLPAGVYILEVITSREKATARLVVE